jgi:hypothetical protein
MKYNDIVPPNTQFIITPIATIPISFGFYLPDPEMSKWKKLDEKLRNT